MELTSAQHEAIQQLELNFQTIMQDSCLDFMEDVSKQTDQPARLLLDQLSRLVGDIVWRISDQTELPQMGIETIDGLVAYLCSTVVEQAMNTVSSLRGAGPFTIVHREGSPESVN